MFYIILVFIVVVIFCIPLVLWFPPNKKIKLEGLHIVITGGSSGIGKALAIEAVKRQANVSLLARNECCTDFSYIIHDKFPKVQLTYGKLEFTKLDNARKEVEGHKILATQEIRTFCADITDYNQLSDLMSEVRSVDILINCAGMAKAELFEDNLSTYKQLMDVNYFGSVNVTFSLLPKMKAKHFGHVVFVSSVAGQIGIFGYAGYSASKFALRGLAESLLMEVRPYGIGVSIAFPPDTDTPGLEAENKDKPEETQLISASAGIFSPSTVARDILDGIQAGKFLISSGMDSYLINILNCGASLASSRFELLIQAFFMGIIRLVMSMYSYSHHKIAAEGAKKRRLLVEAEKQKKNS